MEKTRGDHTYRPRLHQSLSSLAAGPSPAAVGSPALEPPLCAPPQSLLPQPLLLVMLGVPPLWPLPRGDIILESGPHHQILHILDRPERPHRPRGPGYQAQGSRHHRDLGPCPLHLIRVLLEPQTCPRGPSSAALLSLQPHPGEC